MLEDEVDEKYYLSDKQIERIRATTYTSRSEQQRVREPNGICNTLAARDYKDPKCVKVADYRYDEGLRIRKNGISPTLTRKCGDGSVSGKPLLIKNNTKKGYLEAEEGDGVYTSTTTKRATVQKEIIPALTSFQDKGVVVKDEINVIGNYSPSGHDASRIVDSDGLAPTVKENHGTVTATVVKEEKLPGAYGRNWGSKGKIQDDICNTLTSAMGEGGGNIPLYNNLRIRKLTPKECWRLMGFDDSDFDKAAKVNSNSQLYKQAGNSIVVNVLEKIFRNLLLNNEDNEEKQLKLF